MRNPSVLEVELIILKLMIQKLCHALGICRAAKQMSLGPEASNAHQEIGLGVIFNAFGDGSNSKVFGEPHN